MERKHSGNLSVGDPESHFTENSSETDGLLAKADGSKSK